MSFLTLPSRPLARAVALIGLFGVFGPLLAAQNPPAAPRFRPDRILVKPKPGANLSTLHDAAGVRVLRVFPEIGNLQILELPAGGDPDVLAAAYRASGDVRYAERDAIVRLQAEPNDFRYRNGDQWNLNNLGQYGGVPGADVKAPAAWDIQRTAPNIVVAVIDTGIRLTHEDLAPNLWVNPGESGPMVPLAPAIDKGLNLLDDDGNGFIDDVHGINAVLHTGVPLDDHGHGTHVSGIIGAAGNNSVGVVGVAWQVQLMACKAFDAQGNGAISDLVTCIDYARDKRANIINASWGDPSFYSNALYDAIARAAQAGIIFVAAAGNQNSDNDATPTYPANFGLDNIVVVAATDRSDLRAPWSNFGATTVHLAAPGAPVFSCWNGSDTDYVYYNGTSMATPHVVGACALVLAHNPTFTYAQVINRVLGSVDVLPDLSGKTKTGGRLNLQKALTP